MVVRILNLGILAHVDAGKTSLTERLLYEHGVISKLGSVDAGTTTTDSGDLERERGITIRSAVASFNVGNLRINLVDTPGHPDFIAEVERALAVLDGVILVVSSVEGVQAQTKVLMRSLRKIGMPTIIFANKIDRMGARTQDLLAEIKQRLIPDVMPVNMVVDAGGPNARIVEDALVDGKFSSADQEAIILGDDRLLAKTIEGVAATYNELLDSLAVQTGHGQITPLFFGSALKGIGIDALSRGIERLLPSTPDCPPTDKPARGIVFAIDRSYVGDKIAYVRLFDGALKARQSIIYAQRESNGQIKEHKETVSAIELVAYQPETRDGLGASERDRVCVTAGNIAKVRGWSAVRVGARLGPADSFEATQYFQPPSLETIIQASSRKKNAKLHTALMAMSDEDPLIQARVTADGSLSVKLYGEVQKEVIRERLIRENGIEPVFSETQPVYFERPIGVGRAEFEYDTINVRDNLFPITVGLRVEPNAQGSGNKFVREAKWGLMPSGFYRTIEESAMKTLSQGLYGWEVSDCIVYLTKVAYERPLTVAAHFRYLTAVLVLRALQQAKTQMYEPYQVFELDVPDAVHGSIIQHVSALGAEVDKSDQSSPTSWVVTGSIPARMVQYLTRELPALTNGEGALVSYPGSAQPIRGQYPLKERLDGNPLDYDGFVKFLLKNKLL